MVRKSRKKLLQAVIQLSKDLNEEAKPKMHQEVIGETQVQKYLKEGWTFVSTFNATHAIVEIEEEENEELSEPAESDRLSRLLWNKEKVSGPF